MSTWTNYSVSTFSLISAPIKVSRTNIKNVILAIDEFIVLEGLRLELFQYIPLELLFQNNTTLDFSYKMDRLNSTWNTNTDREVFSILQIFNWSKYVEIGGNHFRPLFWYYELENSRVKKKIYQEISPSYLDFYSDHVEFKNSDNGEFKIFIESSIDIWFEKTHAIQGQEDFQDNSKTARLNTPRLNTFLKNFNEELKKYGSYLMRDKQGIYIDQLEGFEIKSSRV